MTQPCAQDFLAGFDDSCFPADFLQRYELMECLAQSAQGETLLVKDRQTGEYSVAKCYAAKAQPSPIAESDLLKRWQHPGLPAFRGEYQNATLRCVVRAYVPGQSLDKLAPQLPLTSQQAIAIAVQLCDILTYLHGQTPPVIHRDLKPQNIILDERGKVTLIDFGISRLYNAAAREDTAYLGTRHYAAPEQYGFSQTDGRTDIFALGVVLCWLLTGKVDVEHALTAMPARLANIVATCTAFAPNDRYQTAVQVKAALTGRAIRRRAFSAMSAGLIVITAILLLANSGGLPNRPIDDLTFTDPQIEQAVRLRLGKINGEALSPQDLLAIEELYIFGDKAAPDEVTFNAYGQSFVNNDGTIRRGGIKSLDDLAKLKNLRRISLVYQNITDLTPLAGLLDLDNVDLRHNPLADVTPLARVSSLRDLGLFDTNVTDLTVLQACPNLSILDIGYTPITSTTALDGLDVLQVLRARRAPLRSLDHIETHRLLAEIYLSETQLLDLSPLLKLPRLKVVEVDDSLRAAAEAVADQATFKIIYP